MNTHRPSDSQMEQLKSAIKRASLGLTDVNPNMSNELTDESLPILQHMIDFIEHTHPVTKAIITPEPNNRTLIDLKKAQTEGEVIDVLVDLLESGISIRVSTLMKSGWAKDITEAGAFVQRAIEINDAKKNRERK